MTHCTLNDSVPSRRVCGRATLFCCVAAVRLAHLLSAAAAAAAATVMPSVSSQPPRRRNQLVSAGQFMPFLSGRLQTSTNTKQAHSTLKKNDVVYEIVAIVVANESHNFYSPETGS